MGSSCLVVGSSNPSSSGEEAGKEFVTREATREEQTQASPAQQEALQQALARLKAETVKKAAPLFEEAWDHFRRTIDLIPEEDRKPMKPILVGTYVDVALLRGLAKLIEKLLHGFGLCSSICCMLWLGFSSDCCRLWLGLSSNCCVAWLVVAGYYGLA